MPVPEEVERQFVDLLGHVYAGIRWQRMSTSKNPWDIWNHRVRAAATRATLGEFTSRLANQFGLQSLPPGAVELVEALRPYERDLLDLAYREHIPVAMRAVRRARELRAERSGQGQGQGQGQRSPANHDPDPERPALDRQGTLFPDDVDAVEGDAR